MLNLTYLKAAVLETTAGVRFLCYEIVDEILWC